MSDPASGRPRSALLVRGLLGLLCLAAFAAALWWVRKSGLFNQALQWIESLGPWAPAMFILLYVAVAVLLVPASILTFGAGVIFGMTYGSVYVLIAANIASLFAFLTGRHFAREWVERKLGSNPKFKALDEAVAREGWKIVALVRLAPVFPFGLMSYGFGITRIPFWHYFFATFCMIPGTLMYIYFGSLVGDLAGLEKGVKSPPWVRWTILVLAIIVTTYVARFARRALAKKTS